MAWAGGQVIGSLAAGALASLIAFQSPFVALAVAFLLTLVPMSGHYGER